MMFLALFVVVWLMVIVIDICLGIALVVRDAITRRGRR